MAFREVTVFEIKEVIRQWVAGVGKKRIAARVGLDPKTVRRYIHAAGACGLALGGGEAALGGGEATLGGGEATLGAAVLSAVVAELSGARTRERGEAWHACVAQRAFIERMIRKRVGLSKIRRLLLRQGVQVPYSTLHRFATIELGFCRAATASRSHSHSSPSPTHLPPSETRQREC